MTAQGTTGQAGGDQDLAYAYAAAWHHVHEQTVQAGITYQDQTLGYDALGRLRHGIGTRHWYQVLPFAPQQWANSRSGA